MGDMMTTDNQKKMIELIKAISGQANVLTIPRLYINLVKSHRAALFLSQCVYWSGRGHSQDGWFYKSFREWKSELGLNQHAAETCVRTLKAHGLLETELKDGEGGTTWYKVNIEKLSEALAETAIAETAKGPYKKTIRPTYTKITSKTSVET